jgi:hypothetical protein
MDPLAVIVAFSHHLRQRRDSYPATRSRYHPDWVSKLISVVDVYEALTGARPYKQPLPPDYAFRIMLKMPGLQDRLGAVKLLYDCLGPFPAGTVVELTTGECAVVVAPNPEAPFRPRVRVVTDGGRNQLPFPLDLDLGKLEGPTGDVHIARTLMVQSDADNFDPEGAVAAAEEMLGGPLHDDAVLMAREG